MDISPFPMDEVIEQANPNYATQRKLISLSIRRQSKQIQDNPERSTGISIAVSRQRMPNGFH
jgi:hypothetical protein